MKYRKKALVIEAHQWNHQSENFAQAPGWLKKAHALDPEEPGAFFVPIGSTDGVVMTPHGRVAVQPNDWIIRGPHGDLYPCKPDIFSDTYEEETT